MQPKQLEVQTKQVEVFRGTHKEIGLAIGRKYALRDKKFGGIDKDPETLDTLKSKRTLKSQFKLYENHYPKFLDYVKGIAEGGLYDEENVFWELACKNNAILPQKTKHTADEKGCTIFHCNGLVGRNHDNNLVKVKKKWVPMAEKAFGIFKFNHTEPGFIDYFAIGDRGFRENEKAKGGIEYMNYFPDDAINKSGLFIGPTFAYHGNNHIRDDEGKPRLDDPKLRWDRGIKPAIMIQLIAETCKTVKDAIEKFKEIRIMNPKNFVIADRSGNAVVVEHTGRYRYRLVEPTDGILLKTNHFLHKDLKEEDTWKVEKDYHTTELRYDEVMGKLFGIKDTLGFEDVEKIMCDKTSKTCQNDKKGKVKTTWSLTLDMNRGVYELRYDLFGEKMKRMQLEFD